MRVNENDPSNYDPQQSYAAKQLSRYDMQVAGTVVYLVIMTMFFVVALVMMLFRNEPVNQAQAQVAKPAISATVQSAPRPCGGSASPVAALLSRLGRDVSLGCAQRAPAARESTASRNGSIQILGDLIEVCFRSTPSQLIHVIEEIDVGAQGCERPE